MCAERHKVLGRKRFVESPLKSFITTRTLVFVRGSNFLADVTWKTITVQSSYVLAFLVIHYK